MVIWWIRRDLRLSDNTALQAALARNEGVIPVFVLDPHRLQFPAAKRHGFLYAGLRRLDESLRQHGSRLIVRRGSFEQALGQLVAETGATAIYAEEAYAPFSRWRDERVAAMLPLNLVPGLTLHHPAAILTSGGQPHSVFTPFMRAWLRRRLPSTNDELPVPGRLPAVPESLMSAELPEAIAPSDFPPGEGEAQRRLRAFTSGPDAPIHCYHLQRDRVDLAATSALSPYLRFGMLSARQAVLAAQASAAAAAADPTGAHSWLRELIWREFYHAMSYHFPQALRDGFRPHLKSITWSNNPQDFFAWREGRTGYPLIDAAMRQLAQTGWMHNRARMIVASFLVKDLLIDWRWGESWFMEHLVDGEVAANNGGWQWVAGAGADAVPYFRVFNPVLQSRAGDPLGAYIRHWVPELERVPDAFIHTPWTMPASVQSASGCPIGAGYPAPIVDHFVARRRALAAYSSTYQAGA